MAASFEGAEEARRPGGGGVSDHPTPHSAELGRGSNGKGTKLGKFPGVVDRVTTGRRAGTAGGSSEMRLRGTAFREPGASEAPWNAKPGSSRTASRSGTNSLASALRQLAVGTGEAASAALRLRDPKPGGGPSLSSSSEVEKHLSWASPKTCGVGETLLTPGTSSNVSALAVLEVLKPELEFIDALRRSSFPEPAPPSHKDSPEHGVCDCVASARGELSLLWHCS